MKDENKKRYEFDRFNLTVTWPTKKQAVYLTIEIILFAVAVALIKNHF